MSRIRKFLNQKASHEAVSLDSLGEPIMNKYGELQYDSAVLIPCRRERYVRDVETSTGALQKSSSRYVTVDEISLNDKLDGLVVLIIGDYVYGDGTIEGYRSIT